MSITRGYLNKHHINFKSLCRLFWMMPLLLLTVVPVSVAVEYSFYRAMPMTFWVEYYAVVPAKESFIVSEKLRFKSDRVVHRRSRLSWNDILHCDSDNNGRFGYHSHYPSSDYSDPDPRVPLENRDPWTYDKFTPHIDAICYIKSITTLHLKYGIDKTQVVYSPKFTIFSVL